MNIRDRLIEVLHQERPPKHDLPTCTLLATAVYGVVAPIEAERDALKAELAEARATIEQLQGQVAMAVQRAGQARADADRTIGDIRDTTEAEVEQLRADLAEARQNAKPRPKSPAKHREAAAMYRLVRTTPKGVEKTSGLVPRTRDAATIAAQILADNTGTPKGQAQKFAGVLDRMPLGHDVMHASGYMFRIEKVAAS